MFKLILSTLVVSAMAISGYSNPITDAKVHSDSDLCGGPTATLLSAWSDKWGSWYFTTDAAYMQLVLEGDYVAKANAAQVFTTQVTYTVPMHDLSNPTIGDHLYTTDEQERAEAIANDGYEDADDHGLYFVFPKNLEGCGTVPLYRMYSVDLTAHFYSVNETEVNDAVNNGSYIIEGIQGFVYPP